MTPAFHENGYHIYPVDAGILQWAKAALPLAHAAVADPDMRRDWLRCQGTWFVGVDALDTGPAGQAGDAPLSGAVIEDLAGYLPTQSPMHKGQLSAIYPGYPKPREGEGQAAFNYRLKRDAAHVDGLHAVGDGRRRKMLEYHAYLLGLPLNDASSETSPLVVWQGSHKIVGDWLRGVLQGIAPEDWPTVDLTDSYQATRRKIFETCPRVELPAKPGQAVLVHRHMLHGIAPWGQGAEAPPEGRMIAYFRPEVAGDRQNWLDRF